MQNSLKYGDPKTWTNGFGNKGVATFGAGCYWGTEKYFKDFAK